MPTSVLAREFYDAQVDTLTGDVTWCNECVLDLCSRWADSCTPLSVSSSSIIWHWAKAER